VRSPFAPSRLLYSLCDMASTDQPTRSQTALPAPGFFVKEDEYLINYATGGEDKIPPEFRHNARADFTLSEQIKRSTLPMVSLDSDDMFSW